MPPGCSDLITGVVAIDAKTIKQLEASLPTWHKFHPEMRTWPWVVIYDAEQITGCAAEAVAESLGGGLATYWSGDDFDYETQREKMLSAFVCRAPWCVWTDWWMKIDCDSLCVAPCEHWLDPSWFEPDDRGEHNAWIASSWPYTRAKGGGGTIAEWCEKLEAAGDDIWGTPRLGLASHLSESGGKLLWPRMASWLSFYNTEWTRQVARQTERVCDTGKIPLPSQDTWHWYAAERGGHRRLAQRLMAKRRGWTNVPRLDSLRRRAQEVMRE